MNVEAPERMHRWLCTAMAADCARWASEAHGANRPEWAAYWFAKTAWWKRRLR